MIKPICTVILISYNHEPYIAKCIESVLSQKTKYSYIVKIFDDASTDRTQDIIKEYVQKYPDKIIPYLNEKNLGAQGNIWRAYKCVDTKYCILTETDDCWCDNQKLQLQIEALEKHPECSFCGHNTKIQNLSTNNIEYEETDGILTNPILDTKKVYTYDDFKPITNGGYIPYQSARLLRTEYLNLDKVKNKETVIFDFNQFYWFLTQGNYYYIPRSMSVYQRSDSGICSSKSAMKFLNEFIERTIDFNKDTNFKYADKICTEVILQSNFRLSLTYENQEAINLPKISTPKFLKYKILSKILLGKKREYYKRKYKEAKKIMNSRRK